VVNGFSKSFGLAGHRLGYLIFPEEKFELVQNLKATLNVCTSLPSQIFGEIALRQRGALLAQHRTYLDRNRAYVRSWASRNGVSFLTEPCTGFYALLDLRTRLKGRSTEQLALQLVREYNLAAAPGIDFGREDLGFFRLNYACPPDELREGCLRLVQFLRDVEQSQIH
jgi:aspartate/methionine/tyrosine aminotransferase